MRLVQKTARAKEPPSHHLDSSSGQLGSISPRGGTGGDLEGRGGNI